MTEAHDLPDMDPTAIALGYAAAAIEAENPGFLDRWLELAEDDKLHAEIRRLREPAPNPAMTEMLRRTIVLIRHIRFVALAHMAGERRRRKGG